MLIFDIGANVGNFSRQCIDIFGSCKIIMVEPNLDLKSDLEQICNENIIYLPLLASTFADQEIDFYKCANYNTISTSSIFWVKSSRFANCHFFDPIKIKSISLDKMIDLYGMPDLIKIDVEGYEYEVLLGLNQKCRKICFEWAEEHIENLMNSCHYLNNIGYKDFGFTDNYDGPVEPETYEEYDSFIKTIGSIIDLNRKQKWGMIWAK